MLFLVEKERDEVTVSHAGKRSPLRISDLAERASISFTFYIKFDKHTDVLSHHHGAPKYPQLTRLDISVRTTTSTSRPIWLPPSPTATPQHRPPQIPPYQPRTPTPEVPLISLDDDGESRRPRDARLIHLVLSSLGIHSYQERVPLQLLDFAYRYTSSVLSDSLRLSSEGYTAQNERNSNRRGAGAGEGEGTITVTALRQAIASRTGFHFQGPLPKEFMLEQATERNRLALPKVERGYGVLLPPEKYCLTGVGWNIRDEWESETDEGDGEAETVTRQVGRDDERMGGIDGADDEEDDEDEEGVGRMEDVFGEDDEGGDTSMTQE